ncbi:MAG: hypothetical protein M3Q65_05395 [Chloroflexota bacterium]|nr:hypothetical protein [Chloroflexota bacterium]
MTCTATDVAGNNASASAGYTVRYAVCALYDQAKAHKLGSTVPLKLQLCDAAGVNQSAAGIVVTALRVAQVDDTASPLLAPADAGNANPEHNFRHDPALGGTGGYIYNFSTTGLATGTWRVTFAVDGVADPAYAVTFDIR